MSKAHSGGPAPVENAEVCVVGAGPAGALLAYSLARRGHEVVVLDTGERVERSRVERLKREVSAGGHARPQHGHRVRGVGASGHRDGVTPRLREVDFEMESRYGVGRDWPISYADLRPYYARVEAEIGVAGDDAPFQPPREESYPKEPVAPSYSDRLFTEAAEELGIEIHSLPMAINTDAFDRRGGQDESRPQICPPGARYSPEVHVDKARYEGATRIEQATVQRLEHGPDGQQITEAVYTTPAGDTYRQQADVFVAATGAAETARLLLLSASAQYPDGLANSSGTVGRYLLRQQRGAVVGTVPGERTAQAEYRPPVSAGSHQFYDDGAGDRGSITLTLSSAAGPSPPQAALDSDAFGDDLHRTVADRYGDTVGLRVGVETLPRADNRLTLADSRTDGDGLPVPDVQFQPGEFARRAQQKGIQVGRELIEELGGSVVFADGTATGNEEVPEGLRDEVRLLGGTRMGTDPTESVVDPTLRTHDLENCYISGGGVFVTSGAANPTLTIMALSLRAADHIHERLST